MTKDGFNKLYARLYSESLTEYNNSGRTVSELKKNSTSDGRISNEAVSALILAESTYICSEFVKKVLESVLRFDD